MKNKVSEIQLLLTILFTTCLVISNIITAKQVLLPFNITTTGAVFVFPITYVLSDVFSEVYGYRWSRITCYIAFTMNLLAAVIFMLVIQTPAPSYWENQAAFETVLGNTPRTLVASFTGFIFGDFVNDRIFRKMKQKYPNSHKRFGVRAIVSSLFGETCDSLVFFPIAFLGQMPVQTLITMGVCQVLIKTGYEVVILPLTRYVVKKVSDKEELIDILWQRQADLG